MKELTDISLKPYNSFGIDAKASQMFIIQDIYELSDAFENVFKTNIPWLILGGGSNVLFTGDYHGAIIKISLKGIQVLDKTAGHIYVKANAGEEWDRFVEFCVENNWGGLENLSYIPGNAGASPIQNIGAYGSELKDCFHSLEAMDIKTGIIKRFKKDECNFGYRTSIFKTELKNKYVICSVIFKLNLNYKIQRSYKALDEYLTQNKVDSPAIYDMRRAVIKIRKSKLPDPKYLGNSGSFFKNPVISKQSFDEIRKKFPDISAHKEKNGQMKISAGWLIEQAGWKGYRKGNVGVYDKQALIIVNHGKAKGSEVLNLANMISKSIYEKFGVKLEPEVNIIH